MRSTLEQEKRQRLLRLYIRGAVRDVRAALRNVEEQGRATDSKQWLQIAGDKVMQALRLLDEETIDAGDREGRGG